MTLPIALQYDFDTANLTSTVATDVSGNGNNGTPHGFSGTPSTVAGTTNVQGRAIVFNATSSQYIQVPASTDMNQSTYTLTAWIKYTGSNGPDDRWTAIGKGHCYELQIRTGLGAGDSANTNHARFGSFYGGEATTNWQHLDSASALTPNVWHHLAGVYTGTHVQLWIDGVLDQEVAESRAPNTNTDWLGIGVHHQVAPNAEGPNGYWDGNVKLPTLYSRALTAAEIFALANPGPPAGPQLSWTQLQGDADQFFTVIGQGGKAQMKAGKAPINVIPISVTDVGIVLPMKFDTEPTGGLQSWCPSIRVVDAANYTRLVISQVPGGHALLELDRQIANVNTSLATHDMGIPQPVATTWWACIEAVGATIKCWVWSGAVTDKPATPTMTGTDGVTPVAGAVGVRFQAVSGNTNLAQYTMATFRAYVPGGGGDPPICNTLPSLTPDTVTSGVVMTASQGAWTGASDAPTFLFQERDFAGGAITTVQAASSTATYTPSSTDVQIRVRVSHTNGFGTTNAYSDWALPTASVPYTITFDYPHPSALGPSVVPSFQVPVQIRIAPNPAGGVKARSDGEAYVTLTDTGATGGPGGEHGYTGTVTVDPLQPAPHPLDVAPIP